MGNIQSNMEAIEQTILNFISSNMLCHTQTVVTNYRCWKQHTIIKAINNLISEGSLIMFDNGLLIAVPKGVSDAK